MINPQLLHCLVPYDYTVNSLCISQLLVLCEMKKVSKLFNFRQVLITAALNCFVNEARGITDGSTRTVVIFLSGLEFKSVTVIYPPGSVHNLTRVTSKRADCLLLAKDTKGFTN